MATHVVCELTSVKPTEISKRKVTVAIYNYIIHTLFPIDWLFKHYSPRGTLGNHDCAEYLCYEFK